MDLSTITQNPEPLVLKETEETPMVHFDAAAFTFMISGKSYMEDVLLFYNPVTKWLSEYGKNPLAHTYFDFKMEYLNTSSSKIVLDILQLLANIRDKDGHEVTVRWHFYDDDEDIEDIGKEYAELSSLPFEFIPVQY